MNRRPKPLFLSRPPQQSIRNSIIWYKEATDYLRGGLLPHPPRANARRVTVDERGRSRKIGNGINSRQIGDGVDFAHSRLDRECVKAFRPYILRTSRPKRRRSASSTAGIKNHLHGCRLGRFTHTVDPLNGYKQALCHIRSALSDELVEFPACRVPSIERVLTICEIIGPLPKTQWSAP